MQSRVLAILVAVVLALVATAAMVVYVNGADRRALAGQQPTYVWVAVKPIPQGMSGEDAQINKLIDRVPVPARNALRNRVLSLDQLRNRSAAVNIPAGEQLLLERWVGAEDVPGRQLLSIPEGHQAVSVGVDLVRQVAGFVTPGDRVNVAVTMPEGGEGGDKTQYVLQDVRVLAVGATALTRSSTQANGGRVNQGKGSQTLTAVTLAVANKDVKPVIFAAEKGSIYLTLLPPDAEASTGSKGKAANESDIFGGP
jgi:pilus assembly protein CpaB